ncbi:hypothetical protein KC644_02175 [Candidatus Berkelbacteria bacterium]|nr:hypothetical protein [Candidatus Berkelbacteria bacterium]
MNDFYSDVDQQKERGHGSACTWWGLLVLMIIIVILGSIFIWRTLGS